MPVGRSFSVGRNLLDAEEETRTPTALRPLPPQSSAATSYATSASKIKKSLFKMINDLRLPNVLAKIKHLKRKGCAPFL